MRPWVKAYPCSCRVDVPLSRGEVALTGTCQLTTNTVLYQIVRSLGDHLCMPEEIGEPEGIN